MAAKQCGSHFQGNLKRSFTWTQSRGEEQNEYFGWIDEEEKELIRQFERDETAATLEEF